MKHLIIIACLFVGAIAFGQKASYQWVELMPQDNPSIFTKEGNNALEEMKLKILEKKFNIYEERLPGAHYKIPLGRVYNKGLYNAKAFEEKYFQLYYQSDIPLTDEMGEPKIKTNEDGTQEFMYPPARVIPLQIDNLSSIRVKEEKGVDETTALMIGFSMEMGYKYEGTLFWVKLDDLKNTLSKEHHAWVNLFLARNYKGFQYMQSPVN